MPTQLKEENTNSVNEATTIFNDGASQIDLVIVPKKALPSSTTQAVADLESSTVVSPFKDAPSSPPSSLPRRSIGDLRRDPCENLLNRFSVCWGNITMRQSPKPAYGRQGLDWIVGPGYSLWCSEPTKLWKPTKNHEKP